jgi:hypothetical protein
MQRLLHSLATFIIVVIAALASAPRAIAADLPQITIQSVSSPRYSSAGNAAIDVVVVCSPYGTMPMTLVPNDPVAYLMGSPPKPVTNAQLYAQANAGAFGVVAAYVAPTLSPQQVSAAALHAGIAIKSTSTPSLNGTYAVTPAAQSDIAATITGIAAGEGLPGGGPTFIFLDASGAPHTFTQAQFVSLAAAIRNYVYALNLYATGHGSQPAARATIR